MTKPKAPAPPPSPAPSVAPSEPLGARDDGWIATYTGAKVYPTHLRADDLNIVDVAHALSNLCRFTGHVREFYSVAQHSVLVSQVPPYPYKLWGLLHDATEAYLADISRPLKRSPAMEPYRVCEERAERAVAEAFGLPWPMPPMVKLADNLVLATEGRALMPTRYHEWVVRPPTCPRLDGVFPPALLPKEAERLFLTAFADLTHGPHLCAPFRNDAPFDFVVCEEGQPPPSLKEFWGKVALAQGDSG